MTMHARQHVGEVRERIDSVLLARRDQRVEHGEMVTGLRVSHEEEVRSSERDAS
jgi:hypothetical protein